MTAWPTPDPDSLARGLRFAPSAGPDKRLELWRHDEWGAPADLPVALLKTTAKLRRVERVLAWWDAYEARTREGWPLLKQPTLSRSNLEDLRDMLRVMALDLAAQLADPLSERRN